MKLSEVKLGAVLSYILIAANAIYGLIISPYIMSTIGVSEFGVYKTIGSFMASLTVLDLGIGGTMQRYIAKFRALKEYENSSNFSAMGLIQASVLCVVILIAGTCLFFTLEPIYGASFTTNELFRAKQLFIIQLFVIVFHVFENVLWGIISGHNKFIFTNTIKLFMIVGKIVLCYILLPLFKNSLTIVIVALILEVVVILMEFIFIHKKLRLKIKLYKWDNELFKESFAYTMLLFMQSLINLFNGNIDNTVIGAVIGTSAVAIYSFALNIFSMYQNCAMAVSGVVLPTVTNSIYSGATPKDLEGVVKKFGRVQWMFLGAALFGFLCFGKEFFSLWLGDGFSDCWYLSLILITPETFALVVNVCLAILRAKNLLKFRTISMAYSVLFNAVVTVIGTHFFGYWAAAIGTALSIVIGTLISMNIYYQKKLGIRIIRLYAAIFRKTTLCLIVAGAVGLLLNKYIFGSWLSFFMKAIIFLIVYGILLLFFGLSKEEKFNLFNFKRKTT